MVHVPLSSLLRSLLRRAEAQATEQPADHELLQRFVGQHDQPAFADLLDRHGALVLRVCRQVLSEASDVEDAFQVTFLMLSRKAHTIRRGEALAGWLYRVAQRVSGHARSAAARRKTQERKVAAMASVPPGAGAECRECERVLHEEINRLPRKYRDAVVLCYLNGRTNEEASGELGWPVGTVKIRLTRARALLRDRLTRRGVGLASAALAALDIAPAEAMVPVVLRERTLQSMALQLTGNLVVGETLSASTACLLHASTLALCRTQVVVGVLLGVCVLGTAAGIVAAIAIWTKGESVPIRGLLAEAPAAFTGDCGVQTASAPPLVPVAPLRLDRLSEELPAGAVARIGTLRLRHEDFVSFVGFSQDGKMIVSASPQALRFWDATSGEPIRQVSMPAGYSVMWGDCLAGDGKVRALEAATNSETRLEVDWGKEWDGRAPVLAARPVTAVIKGDRLRFVEAATGKEFGSIPVTNSEGVRVWDLGTEKEVLHIKESATALAIAPDGKTLALGCYRGVRLYEIPSGKESTASTAPWRLQKSAFASTADTLASVDMTGTVFVCERVSGKQVRRFDTEGAGLLIAGGFSADGQTLATMRGSPILLWDVASGKKLCALKEHTQCFALSPDGKTIVTAADLDLQTVRHWDAATGKELRRFAGPAVKSEAMDPSRMRVEIERALRHTLAFSPDGAVLAAGGNFHGRIFLWDVATGVCIQELPEAPGAGFAFSPDGRTVVQFGVEGISLWEVATGKPRADKLGVVKPLPLGWTAVGSLSPEGRILAVATGSTVQLLELPTGKSLGELAGHRGLIETVAFARDGKSLASGSRDSTALIWDITKATAGKAAQPMLPEAVDLEECWVELADADAGRAYRAIRILVAVPEQSVPFLKDHMRPPAAAEMRRIEGLLVRLDSKQFEARQRAQTELEKVGLAARPALEAALAGKPALELQGRLQRLLERSLRQPPTGELLRTVRALEVLEAIGAPTAQPLLESLAKGEPRAELTRQARATLQRVLSQPDK